MREGQAQWCAARLAMAAKALGEIASGEYSIKGEYRRLQAAGDGRMKAKTKGVSP